MRTNSILLSSQVGTNQVTVRLTLVLMTLLVLVLTSAWWNATNGQNGSAASDHFDNQTSNTDAQTLPPWTGVHRLSHDADSFPSSDEEFLISIERTFPSLAGKLGQRANFVETMHGNDRGWRPSHEAIPPTGLKPEEQRAWLAMTARQQRTVDGLEMFFPRDFCRPQEVAANGLRLAVSPVDARPVNGQACDGRMVYRNVWIDTDVLYTAGREHSEEFLYLRSPEAPRRFSHMLVAAGNAEQIARVLVQADGSVNIEDAKGKCVRIEKPYVVDALGTRSETAAVWRVERGSQENSWRLSMEIDATGVVYPLLADPSWATVRHMNQGRYNHTATLLPSGKVLIVGGSDYNDLASAELFDPAVAIWSATGSLSNVRLSHTATMLPSGQVLVVGGSDFARRLASTELFDPTAGTWSTAGSLANARQDHTTSVLSSGKILVVGGYGNGHLASAELFDPTAGTWSAVGSLANARISHTASVLPSGKVLIVGGSDSHGPLASAELFDPVTGIWSATGSLANARIGHTASVLPSGRVLVVGGYGNGHLASAELFDPATGNWSSTGSLANARYYHTASVLPSSKILIVGGYDSNNPIGSAELFDPATGTWSSSGSLASARFFCTSTLLPSGQILVVGGIRNDSSLSSAELFDPTAGTWSIIGSLANARQNHIASVLPSGKVLVVGGEVNGSSLSSVELFDPTANTWSVTGSLANARQNHTASVLPSGKVLVVGGYGNGSALSSVELFDPTANTWSATGSLANARQNHTASVLPSGKVLVVGGSGNDDLSSAELFDPATSTWSATGSLAKTRQLHTASVLPSGKVLVVGGSGNGYSLSSAELFDPTTGTWSTTGSLANTRLYHTASVLPSGKVLVVGGASNSNFASAEIFDPTTGIWSITAPLINARYHHTTSVLPSGQVLVVGGFDNTSSIASSELFDPATDTWSTIGGLTNARYRHTTSVLPSGKVLTLGGHNNISYLASIERFSPDIDSARAPLLSQVDQNHTTLTCSGMYFTSAVGISNQSLMVLSGSGDGTNSSPSNIPCVHLQCMSNDQQWYLNPIGGFTHTSTTITIPNDAIGPCWARVSVNGIFSSAFYVNIAQPIVTTITTTKIDIPDNGDLATLTVHLNRPYFLPVSVDLQANGNATTPNDFTLASSRLVISAGATEATTTITGRNVDRVSGNRNLTIDIANVVNAVKSTPAPSVNLTITSSNRAPTISSTINTLPGIVGGQTSADTPVTKLYFGKIADLDVIDGKGIAVIGTSGSGKWWFTLTNGASWTEIGSVSDAAALLLSEAGSTQVRYESRLGFPENASITYRAWDRTNRNEGERVDISVTNGGTTAFSATTSSTTLPVSSQAAPVVTLSNSTATWTEGTPALQVDGGIICTDADSVTFAGGNITVTITSNNRTGDHLDYDSVLTGGIVRNGSELRTTNGALLGTLSGGNDGAPLIIALTAATTPTIAQTMLRGLTYANISGNAESTPNGTGQRTIVISIDDETAARGASQVKTVTVQAIDEAPIIEPLILSLVPGLMVSQQLIARDPEGLDLIFTKESEPTKGEPTVGTDSGLITYRHTVLDGLDDSFQVRVSDGTNSILTTVNVKVTTGNQGTLRFTSVPPQIWRAGVVLSYTPVITGTTSPVRFSLIPAPAVAKTHAAIDPTSYTFNSTTGTLTIPALTLPDGDYLRFGILAVDTVSGVSAYQPVLLKIVLAGSG